MWKSTAGLPLAVMEIEPVTTSVLEMELSDPAPSAKVAVVPDPGVELAPLVIGWPCVAASVAPSVKAADSELVPKVMLVLATVDSRFSSPFLTVALMSRFVSALIACARPVAVRAPVS